MQFAKDSFYIALRDRLAALNPARTVVVQGRMRPAVLVQENEPASSAEGAPHLPDFGRRGYLPNAFYLVWGLPEFVQGGESARRPLMKIDCRFLYRPCGAQPGAVDRGRAMAALDTELLRLLSPPRTPKCDHAHTPPVGLGTMVFWGLPEFGEIETAHDELARKTRLTIFFFPEVDQT
jgi:hypothetical protein